MSRASTRSADFVGGYNLETLPQGLPSFATNLMPGEWGRDRASWVDNYANLAGVWIIGEDLARETNRVTLHPDRKDKYGMPIPNVHVDDHANDFAMQAHGFQQCDALYKSIGAKRSLRRLPFPSTHNMGTNRMSEKPRDGVVNSPRPVTRREESVRVGRQPVRVQRRGKSHADDRRAGAAPIGIHRRSDAKGRGVVLSRRVSGRWHEAADFAGEQVCECDRRRVFPIRTHDLNAHRQTAPASSPAGATVAGQPVSVAAAIQLNMSMYLRGPADVAIRSAAFAARCDRAAPPW